MFCHPELVSWPQCGTLAVAVAIAPDLGQRIGPARKGVVARRAAILVDAYDLAQMGLQVLGLLHGLVALSERQKQRAVGFAVHLAFHDAAAEVQGRIDLGALAEQNLHVFQGAGVG